MGEIAKCPVCGSDNISVEKLDYFTCITKIEYGCVECAESPTFETLESWNQYAEGIAAITKLADLKETLRPVIDAWIEWKHGQNLGDGQFVMTDKVSFFKVPTTAAGVTIAQLDALVGEEGR